ncbi:putative sensor domain DACNV-containing protein [Planctomyces sp. SH-PL14]|uniref:putative sensor domain DACNV-containing protein n=1 Tax=Planctomyces sp. SH-PL14 TaxID=1632864 RepID=UPI00078EC302|nr:hypothetical protein [Planctomyces sp. SH-PL14]AMV22321.1 hypothetical protein VT03_30755 [Planctomyces sp. SH-PL14]
MPFAYRDTDGSFSVVHSANAAPGDVEAFELPADFRKCPGSAYRREGDCLVPDTQKNFEREEAARSACAKEVSENWTTGLDMPEPVVLDPESVTFGDADQFSQSIVEKAAARGLILISSSVRKLVNLAFYGSLEEEEGRCYPIRLELIAPGAFPRHRGEILRFEDSKEVTPRVLARLAPGLDPTQSNFLIEQGPPLKLWGIGIRDRSLYRWTTNDLNTSDFSRPPRGLVVRSVGPGHLIAEYANTRLGEFKRGVFFENFVQVFSDDGPIRRFLDGNKLDVHFADSSIRDTTHRLVSKCAESGHGGLIAIVGNNDLEALASGGLIDRGVSIGWPAVESYLKGRGELCERPGAKYDTSTDEAMSDIWLTGTGAILRDKASMMYSYRHLQWLASLKGATGRYEAAEE